MSRASSTLYLNNTAQRLLLMEAAISQDENELVQGGRAAPTLGAVPRHVQHVHQHRQQLHHWPVRKRVVLQRHRHTSSPGCLYSTLPPDVTGRELCSGCLC